MSKKAKCLYCYNELPVKSKLGNFCNEEHKKKYDDALRNRNYEECPITKSKNELSENEKILQKKFLQQIGKRKAKEKLTISGGVL